MLFLTLKKGRKKKNGEIWKGTEQSLFLSTNWLMPLNKLQVHKVYRDKGSYCLGVITWLDPSTCNTQIAYIWLSPNFWNIATFSQLDTNMLRTSHSFNIPPNNMLSWGLPPLCLLWIILVQFPVIQPRWELSQNWGFSTIQTTLEPRCWG